MNKIILDKNKIPKHVGIIIDGNRRWAAAHGKTVDEGHQTGAANFARLVDHIKDVGIKYLTVYTLSTENWRKRGAGEVKGLFDLLIRSAKERKEEYLHKGVKIFILGDFQAFPSPVRKSIDEILRITIKNEKMQVNLALNYGGREEIVRAVRKIIKEGISLDQIDERLFSDYLYTAGQPDPDLIIRTGGEIRISNFLLWQASYSEFYFTKILWPDFSPKEFDKAIWEYQQRQRRFGK